MDTIKTKTTPLLERTKSSRIPVHLLLGEYWICGCVTGGSQGRRLLDLLQESHTSFLQLNEVTLKPRTDLATALGSFQSAHLPKEKISVIVLPEKDERNPVEKMFRISESRSFKGAVLLPHCLVQGDLHGIPQVADSAGTYIPQLPTYFPITNARLSIPDSPPIHASTIIINKDFVNSFLNMEGESRSDSGQRPVHAQAPAESSQQPDRSLSEDIISHLEQVLRTNL